MINYLRFVLEPIDDHTRFKYCITYLFITESRLLVKYKGGKELDEHKFLSIMNMHDESIKYRIKKWADIIRKPK